MSKDTQPDATRTVEDDGLDQLLAEMRDHRPGPSPELMARIVGDAAEVNMTRANESHATDTTPLSRSIRSMLRNMFDGIGGLPAAASILLCGIVGFSTGIAGPETFVEAVGLSSAEAEYSDVIFDDAFDALIVPVDELELDP